MKNIRILTSFFIFIGALSLHAQEYTYQAKVDQVNTNGYYKIKLSPTLLGKLNSANSDLRLYDNQAKEQAYFIQQSKSKSEKFSFTEYEIIEKSIGKDSISTYVFLNPKRKKINNISLMVTNTDVRKRAFLSGSNNNENWFIIKNDYLLHSLNNAKDTSELKILNFPLSNYQYFKLEIADKHELPINILRIGYYDTQEINGKSTTFSCQITNKKDSNNVSYYKIDLPELSYLEQLKFKLKDSEFYSRNAIIKVQKSRKNKKKKEVLYFETIASFNLNSNSDNVVTIGPTKLKSFYLEINNKDDQPLVIKEVSASYLNRYLVGELGPGIDYVLKFGNPSLKSPDYDIINFTDKVIIQQDPISHKNIETTSIPNKETKDKSWFESPYFIWTIILIVGLFLGFISIKMIRDLK